MKTAGFVAIRRGLEEHLIAGRVGFFESGVYLVIHLQADYETGVWTGSAARLLATAPRGATLRKLQHALNRLVKVGFIRTFHRHGVRGNYRVVIDKFEPRTGALSGKRLNAAKSDSWNEPYYDSCAVNDVVADADSNSVAASEAAPNQERKSKLRKNSIILRTQTPRVKATISSTPRSEDFNTDLTPTQFIFAVERISGRMKNSRPSRSYWKTCLERFSETFDAEVDAFLSERARALFEQGTSFGEVSESLKCCSADYDLPYGPDRIDRAIAEGYRQFERSRELTSSLIAGKGPSIQHTSLHADATGATQSCPKTTYELRPQIIENGRPVQTGLSCPNTTVFDPEEAYG